MLGKSRPAPIVAKATHFVAPDLTEGRLRAQAAILLRREEQKQARKQHQAAISNMVDKLKAAAKDNA